MKVDEAVTEIEQELLKLSDLERVIASRRDNLSTALSSLKAVQASLNDSSSNLADIFNATRGSQQSDNKVIAPPKVRQSGNRQSVMDYIRKLIPKLEGEFTRPMVMEVLQREIPDQLGEYQESTVNRILRHLTRKGVLEITVPASGRRAGIYRVAGQTDSSLSNPLPDYKTVISPLDMLYEKDVVKESIPDNEQ